MDKSKVFTNLITADSARYHFVYYTRGTCNIIYNIITHSAITFRNIETFSNNIVSRCNRIRGERSIELFMRILLLLLLLLYGLYYDFWTSVLHNSARMFTTFRISVKITRRYKVKKKKRLKGRKPTLRPYTYICMYYIIKKQRVLRSIIAFYIRLYIYISI